MSVQRPLVDWRDAALLPGGYLAAECVGPGGERWPWIIAPLCPECEDEATHGSRDHVPAHERTGRLPQAVRDALGLVHRCGWPTQRGKGPPCRTIVVAPGQRCYIHAEARSGA